MKILIQNGKNMTLRKKDICLSQKNKLSYLFFIYKEFGLLLNWIFFSLLKKKEVPDFFIRTEESAENTAKPMSSVNPIFTTTLKWWFSQSAV